MIRKKNPQKIIFDTDIGNDVDDVPALGMIHALQDRVMSANFWPSQLQRIP